MGITLVTGGAGFIGSHLVDLLEERGEQVLVIDDLSTGCRENLHRSAVELVEADIRDEARLEPLVKRAGRVMHLAAAVGVKRLAERPLDALERNVEGTAAVLRACARWRRPVLIASSSEVYGESGCLPFREEDELVLGATRPGSRWPYAASKLVAEHYAAAHALEHGLPVAIARLFNTAGPRQSALHGMVIPRFVQQALAGEPITVYGDGLQRRCFCHISDVVTALLALMDAASPGCPVVNLGSDHMLSVLSLARRVRGLTGSSSEIVHRPFEAAYREGFQDVGDRQPDLRVARELIGFAPRRDLDRILIDVVRHTSQLETCTP